MNSINSINAMVLKKPSISVITVLLGHMVTSEISENYALNYLMNGGDILSFGFIYGLWGWFVYSSVGMVVSLVILSPIVYIKMKNITLSIFYGLLIGLLFRLSTYFFCNF